MDEWENAIDLEKISYEKGLLSGINDAINGNIYEDGLQSGYIKGLTISIELSYYIHTVNYLVSTNISEISKKRCLQLIDLIGNMSDFNDSTVDYEQVLRDSRVLFQLITISNKTIKPFKLFQQNLNNNSRSKESLDW